MPDAYRPDRSKVVLAYDPDGSRLVAHCDPAAPLAWRNEPVHSLLKQRAAATWNDTVTIFAKAGPRVWAIAPNGDADLGALDPRSPYVIRKRRDGTISVEVHPPVPNDEDMDEHLESRRASFRKALAK